MTKEKDLDCEISELQGGSLTSDITRFVRYGITALGGYLVGQGYLHADTVEAVAAIAATATPIVIGTIIGRMNRKKVVKIVEKAKAQSNPSD